MEEGFSKAAITKCKSIDVLINQTVQGFANYIIRETKSRTADTFLFNVPAPLKRNDKIFDHHNTHASIVEKFNQSLIKYFKKTPVQIFDLHSETNDASGWSNNVYHCDGIHLNGKIFRVMESHFSP